MSFLKNDGQGKSRFWTSFETVIIVIVCSAIMSVVTAIFLNPIGLYAGGVTGISQILLHFLGLIFHGRDGWNYYQSWLGYLNFLFLLPFNVLAWFKLSKKYAIYTTISSVVQTIVLVFADQLQSLHVFYNETTGTYDVLSCAIMSGILGGICNGFMMRRGSTSGGIITLCQYLNLKKGRSVGAINLTVSAMIVFFGAIISFLSPAMSTNSGAIGSALATVCYTLLNFGLENIVLDYVHTAYNRVKMEIVTEKGSAIATELTKDFPHGVTIERGTGAYSNRPKEILNVIVQNYETNYYYSIIKKIDPDAFVDILPCTRIFGRFIAKVIDK